MCQYSIFNAAPPSYGYGYETLISHKVLCRSNNIKSCIVKRFGWLFSYFTTMSCNCTEEAFRVSASPFHEIMSNGSSSCALVQVA